MARGVLRPAAKYGSVVRVSDDKILARIAQPGCWIFNDLSGVRLVR